MSLHKEISFETEVCEHLAAHGWHHDAGDYVHHDRRRALFTPDLAAWVEQTQPEAWAALSKTHGAAAADVLADRLRKSLDERGVLDVLRNGLDIVGARGRLAMAQFRPAMGMNPEITRRYEANRLRVVRQVRYSTVNENCIDLVLYLNGVPVATAELKTDFTQSVRDAVDQYRFDRLPKTKSGPVEPLLAFPGGALVHFAVSNREVEMTTRLEGPATRFLPFNRGDHGGKGNPSDGPGHPTAYLWEEVWQRDSWLEILGRYVVTKRDAKKRITGAIFPRYHQLDATRKLTAKVLEEGPGGRFLIQHSAGSGKTNSIAWSAHFLSELHDADDNKLFSSVIVVSDRNVIDSQLQEFADAAARALLVGQYSEREWKSEAHPRALVVLPVHHQMPAVLWLTKLRIEADTPGRRGAYGERQRIIAHWIEQYDRLAREAAAGIYANPLRTQPAKASSEAPAEGNVPIKDIKADQGVSRLSNPGRNSGQV